MKRALLGIALCLVQVTPMQSQELSDTTSIRKLSAYLNTSKIWSNYPDSQYYYSNKGLEAAKLLNDKKGEADMLRNLGIYYWAKGDMIKTMEQYRSALNIYALLGRQIDVITMNSNIGMVYSRLGDYNKAVSCYYEAIRFLEKSENPNYSNLANTYNSLGLVLRNINDYPSALTAFDKSFKIFTQINDTIGIAGYYINYGTVHKLMNKFDSASHYFSKALRIFEKVGNSKGIAVSYNNLVGTAYEAGKLDDAFQYAQIAYGISIEKGFRDSQVSALISMGDIKLKRKKFREAQEFYNKANSLTAQRDSYKRRLVDIYKGLYNCKKALKEYDEAFRYNDLYIALKDSLYNSENSSTISNLRISYEVDKKDAAIKILEKDSEIARLNRRNLLFLAIAGFTILFFSVLMLLIKIRKDRKLVDQRERLVFAEQAIVQAQLQNRIEREEELKRELDFKNRALTTYTLNLVQKNSMLDEVKNIAKEVLKRPESKDSELRKLINAIDYSFTLDNDWDGFKTYFEQVHPDFFKKLKGSYPNLSTTELRLCSLIRLSLSIKEAAQLLSISPDSVKVARHRIRKKLNLELDNNLTEFIMSV